ncbi:MULTISPECIES: acetolactate synthase small subunit [Corynebacterium]|uniref:Acetolactate synthase small subunit n=1 Tax=Corynebacterium flavescens TaxID=28028 RepID=A0A1L7CLF2_CORFL|nr:MULTISPECIES: acetolactate synthase small subunit [Corynebacterium]APT86674.1 acetolactate synthase [Corynebacterium flavescens]KAA8722841.1 acetolactate synthase small subunit [Corynebacterium flavescens]MDN6099417.1 acetolactate synthase small subunit [Corynebacterium flavescens]MDN6198378.1 acetolactate synthase small subunit [Corynebacterium flavescens]MDN6225482.1 acetolactate synthase small subunit [Corynebacterium flavescens]
MRSTEITRHTLSVLVQDIDGIITRVSGMFTRRGYNLISLVSARTETEGINRLTIVVDASDIVIEQATKQLNKIIPVIKVVELEEDSSVARAIMLVKVAADNSNRPQVVDAVNIFRARVVDVAQESVVVEATGTPGKLAALLEVLEPFGIRELIQSGHVALARGPKAMAPSK